MSGRLKRYWSHLITGQAKESEVARLYRSVQIVNIAPEDVDFNELTNLRSAWQHPGTRRCRMSSAGIRFLSFWKAVWTLSLCNVLKPSN